MENLSMPGEVVNLQIQGIQPVPAREIRRGRAENGFGRAVSRILSAPCGGENHLSERPYPKPVSLAQNAERAAPGFPIWPCTRWGFPCRVACASRGGLLHHLFTLASELALEGGLIFCGTFRRKAFQPSARVYPNRTDLGYAASRPLVFGLSSSGLRRKRFSALPKPMEQYTKRLDFSSGLYSTADNSMSRV